MEIHQQIWGVRTGYLDEPLSFGANAWRHFRDSTNRPGASATPGRIKSHHFSRTAVAFLTTHLGLSGTLCADPEWGFLYWKNNDGRRFSVSLAHTEDAACAILSSDPVGVDIENESRSVDRLVSRLYTDEETRWSSELAVPRIQVWCAKEAVLKSFGTGIQGGLKKVELYPQDLKRGLFEVRSQIVPVTPRAEGLRPGAICVRIERWRSFVVAVAGDGKALETGVQWIES